MPIIIPIKDLKDTTKISQLVQEAKEPVFVSKNGYGEMVVMSMDLYERSLSLQDIHHKLVEAERDFEAGRVVDARESITRIRDTYGL